MRTEKRATLGLSMEIIVIVIISLVILGSGLSLLKNFISVSEQQKAELDQKTEAELERLLVNQGEKVALPLHTAQLYGGDSHVFGIGIRNIGIPDKRFFLAVELSKYVDRQNNDQTSSVKERANSWVLYNNEEIILEINQDTKEPILVKVPKDAPKGEYIYSAEVSYLKDNVKVLYPPKQRFTVEVK